MRWTRPTRRPPLPLSSFSAEIRSGRLKRNDGSRPTSRATTALIATANSTTGTLNSMRGPATPISDVTKRVPHTA